MSDSSKLPVEQGLTGLDRELDLLWTKFSGLVGREGECARILFVSPTHGQGTTTLAVCTALGLARNTNEKVALVETNLYTPAMAGYLSLPAAPGITDCLDGNALADDAVRNSVVDGLYVLSAGTRREQKPGELLRPEAQALFQKAVDGRRYVLIDGPPVIDHPEASFLLEMADYIVVVVQARKAKRGETRRAMKAIYESGTPVLGAIVNRFQSDLPFGLGASAWK